MAIEVIDKYIELIKSAVFEVILSPNFISEFQVWDVK